MVNEFFVNIVAADFMGVVVVIISAIVLVDACIGDIDWICGRVSVEGLIACIVVDSNVILLIDVTSAASDVDVEWAFKGIAKDDFAVSVVTVAVSAVIVSAAVIAVADCMVDTDWKADGGISVGRVVVCAVTVVSVGVIITVASPSCRVDDADWNSYVEFAVVWFPTCAVIVDSEVIISVAVLVASVVCCIGDVDSI